MEKIKSFNESINVKNKRVILRSDFNVPIIKGEIQDSTRIDLSIPFLKSLLAKKAKLMLISHLGRPKNDRDKSLSLIPIFNYLKKNR